MTTQTKAKYEVGVKSVEPIRVAAIHGIVPSVEEFGDTFDRLFGILEEYIERNGHKAGPSMAIYHDAGTGPRMIDMHVELAIPYKGPAAEDPDVGVYELPAMDRVAFTVHKGLFEQIDRAYSAVLAWVREHGYVPTGPMRDVYLSCGEGDSPDYVTEVQFPVEKA